MSLVKLKGYFPSRLVIMQAWKSLLITLKNRVSLNDENFLKPELGNREVLLLIVEI
jgi:hypothetical protein